MYNFYNAHCQLKSMLVFALLIFVYTFSFGQKKAKTKPSRVISSIDTSHNNELVLIQEFTVKASLEETWAAYTTKKGWEQWSTPLAEIDLRVGGSIQTNYNKNGKIGDSTSIQLNIINYVPYQLLTLQAELTDNFPEFMKSEAKDFYNVIYFERINKNKTRIKSYGIGYKNSPKYLSLMKFFISGNEQTYIKLINYLEKK